MTTDFAVRARNHYAHARRWCASVGIADEEAHDYAAFFSERYRDGEWGPNHNDEYRSWRPASPSAKGETGEVCDV
jgi:hypothetical protein